MHFYFSLLQKAGQEIRSEKELHVLTKTYGVDGWVAAVEYFISAKDSYPWAEIPKVLVGRRAYDNWLVSEFV